MKKEIRNLMHQRNIEKVKKKLSEYIKREIKNKSEY